MEPTASSASVRTLITVLHDLAWLIPRTIDLQAEQDPRLDSLPRSELEIMRLLARRPGLTVGEVARELGLQRTNASSGIRSLVRRGLLVFGRDAHDGRISRITPTDLAIRYRDRREDAWARALDERLRALSDDERERILACGEPLQSLAAALARE